MRQEIPATHQNKASQDCTHNSSGSDSLYIHHVNPCCTNAVLLLVQFSCSERWGMQKSSLQDFSEKGCWISAAHHCLPIFSDRLRPQSTTQDAPTCHQCHDSTLQRVHFTISTHHLTSSYIHKNKNLAQDQPDGRKSSVDAHGVSSCLGCSRILRHLISFLTSSQDFRSRKKHGTRNSSRTSEQGQSRLYTQFMRVQLIIHHVNPCCTNAVLLLVQFSCSERWGMQKRSLQDFSEKGCWISAAHHCLPIFSDRLRP